LTEDIVVPAVGLNGPSFKRLKSEIANWKMLAGSEVKAAVMDGGTLKRGVRYSLTCRDVENVANIKAFLNQR
jgi:alkylated DNA repair protein alkB homolog 6